jgi:hypothetical protein
LLPDGNEDEYDSEDIDNWVVRNIAFLSNNPEWGNDLNGNDWVESQKNIHQSTFIDSSKLPKNLQKDNKIILIESA